MICVINFHYKVFINLFFPPPNDDSPRCARVAPRCARFLRSGCRLLAFFSAKISDDGEIFLRDSLNYKRACFLFFFKTTGRVYQQRGKVRRVSRRSK